MQDEATPLIFEESDDGTICTKECSFYQKERHYHCRMVIYFILFFFSINY